MVFFLRAPKPIMRKLHWQSLIVVAVFCVMVMMLYGSVLRNEHVSRGQEQLHQNTITDDNSVTNQNRSLIRFMPLPENKNRDNYTFDNVELYPCSQPNGPGADKIEDLMCIPRPNFLPGFKNPCFRDESQILKCLPYYNILGFDKSGTTDFSARLTSHPAILKCNAYLGKEIYYWGWRRLGIFMQQPYRVMTLEHYTMSFRDEATNITDKEHKANQQIVGDGGPVDGWDFRAWPLDPQNKGLSEPKVLAPQLIRHILKDPKFFFLMREPAERLYSDYFFMLVGDNPDKFDRDVHVAIEMMNSCLRVNSTRQCFFSNDLYHNMPVRLHIGCYSVFIREWLAVFHKKHFFFFRTEDYERDLKGHLQAAFSFLGVETLPDSMMDKIVHQEKKLENTLKKTAGAMFDRTKKVLKEFYEPCNADLVDLLGDEKYFWLDS